ncbi:hypothetical protein GHT06_004909 [Daphnia sinensis]|uniref:Uncharacterized protein n=1 Tax=Daphnia sinensis TaxID=1820382 RepID=A0AAD5KF80_9CRUS|nr:hypothetical protein GHT06_004909 [Daphnia sinensis]
MKKLVSGCKTGGRPDANKLAKSLLLFRNAPRIGGASPAQLVFNRPVRDSLPAHRRSFAPEWQQLAETLEARAHRAITRQTIRYNLTSSALPSLNVGDHVLIQDPITKRWITPGVVVDTGDFRDYFIKTAAGRVFRRNRRFLRQRVAVMPEGPKPTAGTPQIAPPIPPAAPEPEENPEQPEPTARPPPQEAVRKSTRKRNSPQRYPA